MSFTRKLHTIRCRLALSVALAFFAALFFASARAEAATLAISPGSGSFSVGKTISVRVAVDSAGQSVNAVLGQIHFSNDLLTLSSVSKNGIVTLWAQEPSYSNASGDISFQGVILNGYAGSAGKILTLTFRAKAEGTATISISGGNSSVLLNDGQGTDALSSTSGASFAIVKGSAAVTPTPSPTVTPTVIVTPPVAPPVSSPSLMPVFTDYQSPLSRGSFVVVKGTASPNSMLNIALTHTTAAGDATVSQSSISVTDAGTFAFVSDEKATEGSTYTLVASTKDDKHTDPLTLSVKNSVQFVLMEWIGVILAVKMSAALAILMLLLITLYLLYRNHLLKKHLQMAIDKLHEVEMK